MTTRDRALPGFWSLFLNPGHIFKSIFKDAKADNIRSDSPIDAIDNLPLGDREDPDPFTQTEIEKILSAPTRRTQEINMMGFAFWSGLRISELIALAWEDIDLKTGTVNVCRARVNGSYKQTKTKRSTREVELSDPAIQWLQVQSSFAEPLDTRASKIMSRDNRKMLSEVALGLAQFVSEGLGFAKKSGPKWSQAWRKIEINRL